MKSQNGNSPLMILDDTSIPCGWLRCSKPAARSVTFDNKVFHTGGAIEPIGKYFSPVRRNLCPDHLKQARSASLVSYEKELNPQWDIR